MWSVLHYEWKRYFVTPVGYVFLGAFTGIGFLLFYFYHLTYFSGDMIGLYSDMTSFLMFLIPVLTMRTYAEERKNRADQFLMTAPISPTAIVGGKFCAAFLVYILATALLAVPVLAVILRYGTVYWGEVLVGTVGFLGLSCCYIASGLLISALCESQITAAVITLTVHFLFSVVDWIVPYVGIPALKNALQAVSLYERFSSIRAGVLSLTSMVFYLSFSLLLLYANQLALRFRGWRK